MAIYRYDPETRQRKKLTNHEIKKDTMKSLGLDPDSAEDQREYRRQYDIIRKRVKNYNQITPDTKPVKANEVFYRIQMRRIGGADLSAEHLNILATPAINTGTFREQLQAGVRDAVELTIQNQERIYSGLLNKWEKGRKLYEEFLNEVDEVHYIKNSTGEIIKAEEAAKLEEDEYTINEITHRQNIENPQEIVDFMKDLADKLHAKQKEVYNANKAAYPRGWRSTGT